ncbi:MAG: hypothetical protein AB8H80_21565 [Planctomycetota bacterium]
MNAKLQHAACWFGALALGGSTCAQDLTNALRKGDEAAVQAATSALRNVDVSHLGGLMTLLRAGRGHSGTRGAAAELAFAVLGWWSMQDAGIADRLFDSCTEEAWAQIELPLLHLAAIGAADGAPRAKRWIALADATSRRRGWRLLRMVGTDAATMNQNITAAMASDDVKDQLLGLALMWEFEVASPSWTKRLERLYASTQHQRLRQAVLWTLAHTGGFRTQWMLKLRVGLASDTARRRFDALFTYVAPQGAQRLLREIPRLQPAQRIVVTSWLTDNLTDARLRQSALATALSTKERDELFAPAFIKHALGDPTLLDFWGSCLGGDTATQKLACLGLAHLGKAAMPHLPTLANVASNAGNQRAPRTGKPRAAALHAIGALGTAAAGQLRLVKGLVDDQDKQVAEAASWALPRLQGHEPSGPRRRAQSTDAERPSQAAKALQLRTHALTTPQALLGWPAAERRLALPLLLLDMLNEATPQLLEHQAADGMHDLLARAPWHELYKIRARILASLGSEAKVALPLLQWLAPRRPALPAVVEQLQR